MSCGVSARRAARRSVSCGLNGSPEADGAFTRRMPRQVLSGEPFPYSKSVTRAPVCLSAPEAKRTAALGSNASPGGRVVRVCSAVVSLSGTAKADYATAFGTIGAAARTGYCGVSAAPATAVDRPGNRRAFVRRLEQRTTKSTSRSMSAHGWFPGVGRRFGRGRARFSGERFARATRIRKLWIYRRRVAASARLRRFDAAGYPGVAGSCRFMDIGAGCAARGAGWRLRRSGWRCPRSRTWG